MAMEMKAFGKFYKCISILEKRRKW